MRKVTLTAQFEKDVKRAKKRSFDMSKLSEVIRLLHRWHHASGIAHGRHDAARLGQGDLEDRQYRTIR
jgi:mRNA-degrading endonuclease YafQ of YafQ-DinJ toxin-antitoxin module